MNLSMGSLNLVAANLLGCEAVGCKLVGCKAAGCKAACKTVFLELPSRSGSSQHTDTCCLVPKSEFINGVIECNGCKVAGCKAAGCKTVGCNVAGCRQPRLLL